MMISFKDLNKSISFLKWQSNIGSLPFLTIISIMISLTACGGSSGSSTSNSATLATHQPYVQVISPQSIVAFDHELKVGQPVDLFLYYPDDTLSNITWQQTSGPTVKILTPNSKGLSFTPNTAEDYSFEVTFDVNNTTTKLTHVISVTNENSMLAARVGHVVQEQNNVSLRTTLANSLNISSEAKNSITWTQLSGPTVTFTDPLNSEETTNGSGDLVVYFEAPSVEQDTLIEFEVTTTLNSTTYSDIIGLLIEDVESIASNAYFDERLSSVSPYAAASTYSHNLVNCVYSNTLSSSCTFNTLPLIAQETLTPTVDNIMDRVIVSHPWMAERFREFLTAHDSNNDFKNLLRATTAIVIAYDLRPSFYWAATGAIYLDPNNLWLTAEERDTINEAPDFRRNFGNDLHFAMPWRYVKDNDYAYTSSNITARQDRTLDDIVYRLSSLLYHELAHANDFLPATEWNIHNGNVRILDAVLDSNFESDELSLSYPLTSDEMYELAGVSFLGATANNTQKAYLPEDIITFFTPDIASDFYNYSSTREDFAMLFEEFMMQARFNVQRDVAITNLPQGDDVTGSDYIVAWGERGRIGEPSILPRVEFVLERALPDINSTERTQLLAELPSPLYMVVGNDWYENLELSSPSDSPMISIQSIGAKTSPSHPTETMRYYHKALPTEKD